MNLSTIYIYKPALLLSLLLLSACSKNADKKDETQPPEFLIQNGLIVVPQQAALHKQLKTAVVTTGPYIKSVQTPANIEGDPTRMANVTLPFSGRVLKIRVQIGDQVQAGQVLFTMNAPEFVNAQKDYLANLQDYQSSEINLKRQKDLLDNGVGIRREYEEAQRDANIQRSELQNAAAQLKLFKVDPANMVIGQPLMVRSPVSGRLSSIQMSEGQFRNDASETVMVVGNFSEVYITANVKEKDIQYIKKGESATAEVNAYPGKIYKGTILFVDDMLDPETHSLKVRVKMANPNGELKPGMYATATFSSQIGTASFVPAKSVLQLENRSFVFLAVRPDHYRKRFIQTAETIGTNLIVTGGLKAGETVATDGAFYLLDAK